MQSTLGSLQYLFPFPKLARNTNVFLKQVTKYNRICESSSGGIQKSYNVDNPKSGDSEQISKSEDAEFIILLM